MTTGKILIVDDNKNILNALELLLKNKYTSVETLFNPEKLSSFSSLEAFDIILLDMNFKAGTNSGKEGLYWLSIIKKKAPNADVVMITAYGAIDLAVASLKKGASDFVLKPWSNDKLLEIIDTTLQSKAKSRKSRKEEKRPQKNLIVGNSKAITNVLRLVHKVAKTEANILIVGDKGTGKRLIAKELHAFSDRKEEVFVSLDLGNISKDMLERELFGSINKSTLNTKDTCKSKFEEANGGTLFLNHIENLPLEIQSRLLRVIQNKVIGNDAELDIKLICATHHNLEEKVEQGLFIEELFYAINTIPIEVPALRYRGKDMLLLTDFFLNRFAFKYSKGALSITVNAKKKLMEYHWPGNIKELQHTVERAVILSDKKELDTSDFLFKNQSNVSLSGFPDTIEEMEHLMIEKALSDNDGNYSATATQLGISRQTLYNKIKKSL